MLKRISVKPSEFDYQKGLWDTPFRNSEKETIARNIIFFSHKNGDEWKSFSFDDYRSMCSHNVTDSEKSILDGFVKDGLLSFEDDKYDVTDAFVALLWKFVKA